MVASELTLRSDCHDSPFQNHLDSVHNITKMPVAFKPELQTQFGATITAQKANACCPWTPCGNNGIRIHNHLVRKQTFNHLAKLVCRHLNFRYGACFEQGVP